MSRVRKLMFALTPALALGGIAFLSAQEERPARTTGTRTESGAADTAGRAGAQGAQGAGQGMDHFVAASLVLGNQNEIAQARLAQQRSKNQEVTAFAQMMEKEHQQLLSQLQRIAGQQFEDRALEGGASGAAGRSGTRTTTTTTEGTSDANNQNRNNQNRNNQNQNNQNQADENRNNGNQNNAQNRNDNTRNTQAGTGRAGTSTTVTAARVGPNGSMAGISGDMLLQMKRELADECLASSRKELESKQGKEFDKCYMEMQVAEHMKMLDELKVFERHVSSELRPILQQGRETTQKHLQHAKTVKKNVEEGRGGEGGDRSSKATSSDNSK